MAEDTAPADTDVNPSPAGFDLGTAANTVLALAATMVAQHNAANDTPAPTPAQTVAAAAPAWYQNNTALMIAAAVGGLLLWLMFRK